MFPLFNIIFLVYIKIKTTKNIHFNINIYVIIINEPNDKLCSKNKKYELILTKEVEVKVNKKNIDHFKNLGINATLKDIIKIHPNLLSIGSHKIIDVKCDICGFERKLDFQSYKENENNCNFYACSSKCAQEKVKKTSIEKFGEEYYMKTKEHKQRVNETSLKIYGCEHSSQNSDVKEKLKKTNLEKYNVDCVFKNDIIKNKIKNTNIKLYGTENPFASEIIKEKMRDTFLKTYGVDWASKSKDVQKKIQSTNLEKYGVKCMLSLDWVKDKAKKNHIMTPEIIKKIQKTKKDKWIQDVLIKNPDLEFIDIDLINKIYIFKGSCDHIFEIPFTLAITRNSITTMCTVCNPLEKHISGLEIQLQKFIENNYNKEVIINSKKIISPFELDIYLPDLKLAFEFNGLFWHSEYSKSSNYHYNKTQMCEAQGIQLIHIYEDDWKFKQEIVKSRILNLLGKNDIKLYARKCIIKEISDNKEIKRFLENNHLQGFVGSQIKLGLYYNNELVSLMTFGKQRKSMGTKSEDNVYEMLRFCNKLNTTVIGSANKLFNYFIKNYKPKEVISYADRSWSQGNLYKVLGFDYMGKTIPNYYYIVNDIREYRFNYRKDILVKQGFDKNKSEHEIMLERKIYRIYDSGSIKFKWIT